jgi:decaprenyl-phosphate phosphoribosyltransferase
MAPSTHGLALMTIYANRTIVMSKIRALITLARPHQYIKNVFIFLPIFFAHKLFDHHALTQTCWAFVVFCLGASSVYVVNDIFDVEVDRLHPVKKHRPLAAGILGKREALLFAGIMLLSSVLLTFYQLGPILLISLSSYLLLNYLYSCLLKKYAIIDISAIAAGFIIRVFAGGLAADVLPSHWLIIMTYLLALFLALAKRRDDLILMSSGRKVRHNIDKYSLEFVSHSMVIMAAVIIVCYILYTVSPEVIMVHKTTNLYLTSFLVIIGLLRYMQITFVELQSGSPTNIILKDRFLQAIIILWLLVAYLIIY